jgi:UDP-2,4-diacetamido-2,4,6-trideoxy-beta-L-altropyranose hydrolase
MRCIALAQAWTDNSGRAAFASANLAPSLLDRIRDEGFDCSAIAAEPGGLADAAATATTALQASARVVVIDGYHFGQDYRAPLHAAGLATAAIDDNGEAGPCGDNLILNQNIHAAPTLYAAGGCRAKLLLGTRYVLLRREFQQRIRRGASRDGPVRNVLVTLGAVDRDNVTERVMQAMQDVDLDGAAVRIIAGGANPHRTALGRAAGSLPGAQIISEPGAAMADLIAGADLAVTAGGTTMWELAALGVPFLPVVVAENQRLSAKAMAALGYPTVLAENIAGELPAKLQGLIRDAGLRRSLAAAGQRLVDGDGASRVCTEIAALIGAD